MLKKIFILLIIFISFLLNSGVVLADDVIPGGICLQRGGSECCSTSTGPCIKDSSYTCLPNSSGVTYADGTIALQCQPSPINKAFGKIQAPEPIKNFLGTDQTGASGISKFLSNLVALIYVVAAIVLIFMLLWGAFDWITSSGDKEKLAGAQRKIINAFIGIMLFAAAFGIIRILGIFTGFRFFVGQ